ncbi:hypothetical protein LguiA_027681 [Lonicera macranthoides]
MAVDEVSLHFIKKNVTVKEDNDGGILRLVLLKHPLMTNPEERGKVWTVVLPALPQASPTYK